VQTEFQTPPLGFNQALKDMRRIKGSELDRDVETGAGAGPGAVHVPAGRRGRGGGAVDAGWDWIGKCRFAIVKRRRMSSARIRRLVELELCG